MDNEYINELLAKHFAAETTEQEEKELALWIKDHETEYLSLKVFHANAQGQSSPSLFATHKAWQKVAAELGLYNKTTRIKPLIKYISIAASIVIVLFAGLLFYANTTISVNTLGQIKTVTLSDGSVITLNQYSSISYKRYFLTSRNIELNGEAFFDVKHNASKPFKVQGQGLLVNVLGTSFLVKATQSEKQVTVVTGKVAVKATQTGQNITLTPTQGTKYVNGQLQTYTNNSANLLSWKTNKLIFKNTPLQEVLTDMEKYYGVKFLIPKNLHVSCPITTQFDHELLADALKELNLIAGVGYAISGNTVTINEVLCK